jgi:N-acetylglucosaminyldiphosphoundecaprenol N-acetyl-beta-D-mannosaminyltransferase
MVFQVKTKNIDLLGISLSQLSKEELLDISRSVLKGERSPGYIVTLNPEIMAWALKDKDLLSAIKNALFVIPDGIGITWALKRCYGFKPQRIPGIELAENLIQICSEENLPVFFLGSRPEIVESAVKSFQKMFPKINVAGFYHGFFKEEELKKLWEEIDRSGTALLIVGMGARKQEKFLFSTPQTVYRLGITVGGALEIWAGAKKRAPLWMRKYGLEWLYRVLKEPKRIVRLFRAWPFFLRILCLRKKT